MAYEQIGLVRSDKSRLEARYHQIRAFLEQRAARRALHRRVVDELHASSDRDLADLGFHRSEIPCIARQAVKEA